MKKFFAVIGNPPYQEEQINEFDAGKKRLMALGVPENHFTNFDVFSKEFEEYYHEDK